MSVRHNLSRRDYGRALTRHGYKKIGAGVVASVYHYPKSDRVIKVSVDTPWLAFMLWVQKTTERRRWVPKLYSVKWHRPDKAEEYFVAVMERVPELSDDRDAGYWNADAWGDGAKIFEKDAYDAGFQMSDLHPYNWGFRCDGSPVVFDPTGWQFANDPGNNTIETARGVRYTNKDAARLWQSALI